jgi:UDP-3-O-[3-hydroxymyristoyl] glucosamine N-acyltransferase
MYSAQQIVERFGGVVQGDAAVCISKLASLAAADSSSLSFCADAKHKAALGATTASIVVVSSALAQYAPAKAVTIIVDQPYLYFAKLTALFAPVLASAGVNPSATIDPSATLGVGVAIGPNVVIGANCVIGDHVVLDANCVIGSAVTLGDQTVLFPNVTIYSGVKVGPRTRVHSGTVIGADGFGYAHAQDKTWIKIEQLGAVQIGSDVEIGANCTIDRGALTDTVIGDGCKLDNQIQVAHNVHIGARTAIAACVGIAGSAVIGEDCMIGGAAGVLGHLHICAGVTISAMSLVTRSINEPGMYSGIFPLQNNRDWERSAVLIKQLDQMRDRIRALEKMATNTEQTS